MTQDRRINQSIEARITDFIAGFVPWLAPIPSAALVVSATQKYLGWPIGIAIVAGAIIEGLGLTSTSTALGLWEFNARKVENEPKAPFWLAAILVGVYFASTLGLTVVLDGNSGLTHIAPALFPILAIVATVNIALRSQHARRLERIAQADERARQDAIRAEEERKMDAERKRQERKESREARRQSFTPGALKDGSIDVSVDRLLAGRAAKKAAVIDAMVDAYRANPRIGDTELGDRLGVSRQTIFNYRKELEKAGRIHRNGQVTVLDTING